jgi:hypothetical protein
LQFNLFTNYKGQGESNMKNSHKLMAILALVGFGYSVAPSASAIPQAYASGSHTITLMNGASNSVGAEVALPGNGMYYGLTTTTPGIFMVGQTGVGNSDLNTRTGGTAAGTGLSTNGALVDFVTILADSNGDQPEPQDPNSGSTFSAAAAQVLDGYVGNLQAEVSIIRAGAGVDGLE